MPTEASPQGGGSIVEVEFSISDARYPFVRVSDREDCRLELVKLLPRRGTRYAEFFSVEGARPGAVLDRLSGTDAIDSTLIADRDRGGLFEFVVDDQSPAAELAKLGAIPTEVVGEGGEGRLVAEIPPDREVSEIVAEFLDAHPPASLVTKRTRGHSTPLLAENELQRTIQKRLTDRQREVLLAAYEAGYYQRPRETTGEELAERFDITVATLTQHLRAAEQKLIALLHDDGPEI